MNYTPTMDDYNRAKHGDVDAQERIKQAQIERDRISNQFIARMVQEHKASLVKSISYAQSRVNEFGEDPDYWRDVIVKFTAQLELSDAELLPFIHSSFNP